MWGGDEVFVVRRSVWGGAEVFVLAVELTFPQPAATIKMIAAEMYILK